MAGQVQRPGFQLDVTFINQPLDHLGRKADEAPRREVMGHGDHQGLGPEQFDLLSANHLQ